MRVVGFLAGLALLAFAGRAAANGAFPDSDAVMVPVDRPQQIMLATNFGLIISDDGGDDLAVDVRARRDVDGVAVRVGRAPRRSVVQPVAGGRVGRLRR